VVCILGIAAGLLAAGCSKDKGTGPDQSASQKSIFGTWKITKAQVGIGQYMQDLPSDMSTVGETYVFTGDSTGTWKSKDNASSSTFTYSIRADSLIMASGLVISHYVWEQPDNTTMYFREVEPFTGMKTEQRLTRQ
jgi:hypothetical protein